MRLRSGGRSFGRRRRRQLDSPGSGSRIRPPWRFSRRSIADSHPNYALLIGGIRIQRSTVVLSLRSEGTKEVDRTAKAAGRAPSNLGLPVSICIESATPHEVKLATSTLVQMVVSDAPGHLGLPSTSPQCIARMRPVWQFATSFHDPIQICWLQVDA
jgi:hypothetical protein